MVSVFSLALHPLLQGNSASLSWVGHHHGERALTSPPLGRVLQERGSPASFLLHKGLAS